LHHTSRLNTGDPLSGPDFSVVRRKAAESPASETALAGTPTDQLAGT